MSPRSTSSLSLAACLASVLSCGLVAGYGDPVHQAADPSDFYVDPAAPAGSSSFPTITAALIAANASHAAAKTIHLAAGAYGTDESFPIVLRDGTSLLGAGRGQSIVTGSGPVGTVSTPAIAGSVEVTGAIVAGDPRKTTTIAHLSLLGAGAAGSEGIVCDEGTTSAPGSSPANTVLEDVEIRGFQIGVRVATPLLPPVSGCNLRITGSTVADGAFGVLAGGVLDGKGAPAQRVSVQLGDSSGSVGNVLQGFHVTDATSAELYDGAGLALQDAVTGVVVFGNTFASSDQGIWAEQRGLPDGTGMVVARNDFGGLFNAGIQLWRQPVVDRLVGNSFHDITTVSSDASFDASIGAFLGAGIVVDPIDSGGFPVIRYARDNSFVGNDVGVYFRNPSSKQPVATALAFDFGSPDDAGNNSFRCNSSGKTRRNGTGGDVRMELYVVEPNLSFSFEGNVWDHAPPTVETTFDGRQTTGLDLLATAPVIHLSNATAASSPACPAGCTAGP